MKRLTYFSVAAAVMAFGLAASAQSGAELTFTSTVNLINLPAYGEVAGIATNAAGHVFTYVRAGHGYATLGDERTFYHGGSRLFEFDAAGKFVKEIGQGLYSFNFAQAVRVDPQGNIWTVDAGSMMLTKFAPDGHFLMTLGRKPESINVRPAPGVPARLIDKPAAPPAAGGGGGGEGGGGIGNAPPGSGQKGELFSMPADVAFDTAGNVYVADGFGTNNRIAKFNKDGNWVTGWGQTGSGQGQFNKIRGIAIDKAGNVYVADSGNKRIQVFDLDGKYKSEITGVGTPQAICVSGGATQYLFSSNSNDAESMDNGEIYKVQLSGQVVGKFGHAGRMPKEFGMVNAMACPTATTVWLGEVWNWRAQKVTLTP